MFPDLLPGTAAAVSFARFIQEPLAEYASMWHSADDAGVFGLEVLYLDLHPLKVSDIRLAACSGISWR